jgi:hypothetical protein
VQGISPGGGIGGVRKANRQILVHALTTIEGKNGLVMVELCTAGSWLNRLMRLTEPFLNLLPQHMAPYFAGAGEWQLLDVEQHLGQFVVCDLILEE